MAAPTVESTALLMAVVVGIPVLLAFVARRIARLSKRPLVSWFKPPTGVILPADTSLLELRGFTPKGFGSGIEIFNDNTTPMEFVVGVLQKHTRMDRKTAMRQMLTIHYKGGLLLPLESRALADGIAASITADARAHNHGLICRAVTRVVGEV